MVVVVRAGRLRECENGRRNSKRVFIIAAVIIAGRL